MLNKCFKCGKSTDNTLFLVKIKENWFCYSCITYNKDIFNKLKKNGYLYKMLKDNVHFSLDD